MLYRVLVVACALGVGAAQAQLKPPGESGGTGPRLGAPAAPAAPAVDPVIAAKEAAAAAAAADWLKLVDTGEYGKAWDESAQVFRERVPRQQWVDGLPKNRAEVGPLKSRRLDGTAYKSVLPGAPEGEYVTVHFVSEFEKNPKGEELVTMFLQSGTWRPVGYLLR